MEDAHKLEAPSCAGNYQSPDPRGHNLCEGHVTFSAAKTKLARANEALLRPGSHVSSFSVQTCSQPNRTLGYELHWVTLSYECFT